MHFWYWLIARTNSQAQNGVNVDFKVQFDLEGQGQWTPKTIGILTKVFCISGLIVIVAWAGEKLSSGQTDDWRTHTHTHTHTDAGDAIPEGHNWSRVIKSHAFSNFNGAVIEVWEWIGNFIPKLSWVVITYPCCWSIVLRWLEMAISI